MKTQAKYNVTLEGILDNIGEERIFEAFLGITPEYSKSYKNPLRVDEEAGCKFYIDNRGVIKFNDFAKGLNLDCINVVMYKEKCSFFDALQKIAKHFNYDGSNVNSITLTKQERMEINTSVLEVSVRNYNKHDLDFWRYLSIEDLRECKIFPVDKFNHYVRGKKYTYYCSTQRVYAYFFGVLPDGRSDIKIYFPDKQENRFIHNEGRTLQGTHLLNPKERDFIVFTKSFKDVVYMNRLFDIEAIASKSENTMLSVTQFEYLDNNYSNIISLLDNDMTGKRAAIKHKWKYGIEPYVFPKTMKKDFTDNLFHLGINNMNKEIDRFKEIYLL